MSFKHKKKFGQNFLTNQTDILDKIIKVTNIKSDEHIIEIGPGEGALTTYLLEIAKMVTCIEIDRDLEPILRKKFKLDKKFHLVMQDILDVDLKKITSKARVVANIPYYITSPIINKIIDNREIISEMFIMVQKEVAERICAKFGKERGILTLAVEYYAEANYLFTIPKTYFTPVPNVDSAFISIKFYKNGKYENLIDETKFFKYVKALFSNKRKNLINNLTTLGYSKDIIRKKLLELNILETQRAENLTIEQFIKIAKKFE